jgi:hypothetical protein
MGMPSGESPQHARLYYHYLQAHQETMQRADTWHVRWIDLAWLWGFMIVLSLDAAAAGIKSLYQDMLDRAWNDAQARGEKLPDPAQKAALPEVPGQQ